MERKIKIETGLSGDHSKVFIDDIEISDWISGIDISLKIGEYNMIEMKCIFPVGTQLEFNGKCAGDKLRMLKRSYGCCGIGKDE